MPKPKPLSKEQIVAAQGKTKSNMGAARYLHVSYTHYKKYAKMYKLFESHKNQSGKGIPKFLKNSGKEPALLDIVEGRVDASHFTPQKLKYRLIEEGYLLEECSICSFKERRVLDYKMPLLLHFKDNNKSNYTRDNIELLCYNHYFCMVGDVFTEKDEKQIESHQQHNGTTEAVNWELDEYDIQRFKELGLMDGKDEDDAHQYISRI